MLLHRLRLPPTRIKPTLLRPSYSFAFYSMASLKRKADPLTASDNDPKKPKKDASLTAFFGAPKPTTPSTASNGASAQDPAPIKFDKDKWASSLTPEQRSLLRLEIDTLDPSWLSHLRDEVTSREFLDLKRFLQKEIDSGKKIFPPLEEVYSWSRHTPLHNVQAVILGQDPYHNHNQAHGLCFSVRPPTPAPPSLKNMFIALKKDYPRFTPPPNNKGLLTPWAEQGVLLLNTCLTVRAHEANSHANHGWERFTQKVIDTVVKVRSRGVVFLAWGTPAQKRCAKITGMKHLVLKSVHPSPLSAARGFFDCGHFKKTNEWLRERYGVDGEINWDLNVTKPVKGPDVGGPVKVTGDQEKKPTEDGPTTKLPEEDGKVERRQEDFDGEDDEDAIEALEEIARSSQPDAVAQKEVVTQGEVKADDGNQGN